MPPGRGARRCAPTPAMYEVHAVPVFSGRCAGAPDEPHAAAAAAGVPLATGVMVSGASPAEVPWTDASLAEEQPGNGPALHSEVHEACRFFGQADSAAASIVRSVEVCQACNLFEGAFPAKEPIARYAAPHHGWAP